ncbi:retinoblastoma-like protein 2 isoform 2-T3 [Anableps anableps]
MATTPQHGVEKPRPGPSDRLITLFRDHMPEIANRLEDMQKEFLQHCRNDKDHYVTKELEEKCFSDAKKYYYAILDHLSIKVKLMSGVTDISDFLENDLWHRCLMTCCLQMTRKSACLDSDVTLLLNIFKLDSYLFLEETEKLLLRLRTFTDWIRKFIPIQRRVLASSVWGSHSCLWKKIEDNGGFPSVNKQVYHDKNCLPLIYPTKFEDQGTDLQSESEPQRDVMLEAESSASTDHQHSSSAVSRPKGKPFFRRFANMVYREMGNCLRDICSKLEVSDELRLKMWTCFVHSLAQHTSLMKDRHLDHLLISSIYIIAKVTNDKLTFEEIVKNYKFQQYASESVCKEMLISETSLENLPNEMMDLGTHRAALLTPEAASEEDKRGSLINFYHLYSMKMQLYAAKFAPAYGGETPPLSPLPPEQRRTSYQPMKGCNLTVSSLNNQTPSLLSPAVIYNFGNSPRKDLAKINKMVTKKCRTLSFDTEEGEDGPSSKLSRLENVSVLQKQLMNVHKDRAEAQNQNQNWVSQNNPDHPVEG